MADKKPNTKPALEIFKESSQFNEEDENEVRRWIDGYREMEDERRATTPEVEIVPPPKAASAPKPKAAPSEHPPLAKEYYSVGEAAEILMQKPVTVYRLIKRGKLKCLKSLRHIRIPKTELDRFKREDTG